MDRRQGSGAEPTDPSGSQGSHIPQERLQSVYRENACVVGRLWHSTDLPQQVFPSDLPRGLYAYAFCQLRDRRRARHGRHATLRAKSDIGNAIPLQLQSEFQNVATCRILQARGRVGLFNLSCISRILKMV